MIRIGIYGYGNLGRGVECAIMQNPDAELVAVFTRRDPHTVKILTPSAKVEKADNVLLYKDKIDVLIICGGSATDLPAQTPEYAKNFTVNSKGLLMRGETGLGKTHLSLAIAGEVIKKGYLPVYGPAENLFTTIEKERFSGFGAESDSYNSMISCDLLVIDDLGAEFMTSFSKSILYNLVNTRILAKKPTIINTNLSMKEIEKFYSPRISSRLIGSYDARKFLGNDIRQQKILNK
mgnify:CR=1 FL=1